MLQQPPHTEGPPITSTSVVEEFLREMRQNYESRSAVRREPLTQELQELPQRSPLSRKVPKSIPKLDKLSRWNRSRSRGRRNCPSEYRIRQVFALRNRSDIPYAGATHQSVRESGHKFSPRLIPPGIRRDMALTRCARRTTRNRRPIRAHSLPWRNRRWNHCWLLHPYVNSGNDGCFFIYHYKISRQSVSRKI